MAVRTSITVVNSYRYFLSCMLCICQNKNKLPLISMTSEWDVHAPSLVLFSACLIKFYILADLTVVKATLYTDFRFYGTIVE